MKTIPAFLLLAAAISFPEIRYFRFERPVQLSTAPPSRACLVADAILFAHAATPDLADLRVYHDRTETPYVIQTSTAPLANVAKSIPVLNVGMRAGQTVFDAEMPIASYDDLEIQMSGRDFIASIRVSGSQIQTGARTEIGQFTVFDLTNQKLGRSTVLHLPGSDFRFLHFAVRGRVRPEQIKGLVMEHRGTAIPSYVDVVSTEHIEKKGKAVVAELTVPAHVSVDQIEVVPGPTPTNFSRQVTIQSRSDTSETGGGRSRTGSGYGSVFRVHTIEDAHRLDLEQLTVQTYRTQSEQATKWTVTIDNGDDAPLIPRQIKLRMLEKDICFEAGTGGQYVLYYGDPALTAPRYDLGQIIGFHLSNSAHATAGAEQANPEYETRADTRPLTDRHPSLLWITLIVVVGVLAGIAYRTARTTHPEAP